MRETDYFHDFVEYYRKAAHLQDRQFDPELPPTGDPLMDNVPIYDCVERRFAGFCNALQQAWYGSNNPKHWQAAPRFDGLDLQTVEWLWVFLVHRVTGSGASFEDDHGFRNSVVPEMVWQGTMFEQRDWLLNEMRGGRAVFTSIGNQIPPFPKPRDGYARGGELYLAEYAPQLVLDTYEWLREQDDRPVPITEVVDYVLAWHVEHGLKRFKFVLTAWAMDIAEYYPHVVDAESHVYYGANCEEAFDLMFEGGPRNKRERDVLRMDMIRDAVYDGRHPAHPFSLEDVCCDYVRYIECYVPKGTAPDLDVTNRSRMAQHPKHRSFHAHVQRAD